MERTIASLTEQVERLSATSRRQQRWLIALSAVLVVLGCAAARGGSSEVVRARAFEAVGANGKVRAVLSSEWNYGAPALALLDADDEDGLGFAFLTRVAAVNGGAHDTAVILSLNADAGEDDGPNFGVATLAAMSSGGGTLSIARSDEGAVSFGITQRGAAMSLRPNGSDPSVELGATDDGGSLQIRNKDGESTFHAP